MHAYHALTLSVVVCVVRKPRPSVSIGTVLIWYFCVAITKGGGTRFYWVLLERVLGSTKCPLLCCMASV